MKKFAVIFTLTIAVLAAHAAEPTATLSGVPNPLFRPAEPPTMLETSFDGDSLLDWYSTELDSGSATYWSFFLAPTYAHQGSVFAGCYYDTLPPIMPNDDWLITPRVSIAGSDYELRFWARSLTATYPDDYQIWLAPTGDTLVTMFTDSLLTVVDEDTIWTEHVVDLSAYSGSEIRVAFRYNSADGYLLMLDDVSIMSGTGISSSRLAEDYRLYGNSPNPFNASTTIRGPEGAEGVIEIYDVAGRLVRNLPFSGPTAQWDGRTDAGENAACGVYLYRLRGCAETHRMILLK